jgi:hypothetical protein
MFSLRACYLFLMQDILFAKMSRKQEDSLLIFISTKALTT